MTFPIRTYSHTSGVTVTGELVLESHSAYQVAVDGNVRLLPKDSYAPSAFGSGGSFEDLFGGMFSR